MLHPAVSNSGAKNRVRRAEPKPTFLWMAAILLILLSQSSKSSADLGTVIATNTSGPFHVTLRAEPFPMRAGRIFISMAVKDISTGKSIADTQVTLKLTPPRRTEDTEGHGSMHHPPPIEVPAESGRHPGLMGVALDLPQPGPWAVRAVIRSTHAEAEMPFTLEVGPSVSPWIEHWAAFAFPAVGAGIFFWHQRRVALRKRLQRENKGQPPTIDSKRLEPDTSEDRYTVSDQ